MNLRPSDVGLYNLTGITLSLREFPVVHRFSLQANCYPSLDTFKYLYALAGGQGDYGLLPAGPVAAELGALAANFAVDVESVDG